MPWRAFGNTDAERVPLELVDIEEPPSLSAFRSALGPSSSLDEHFPLVDRPTPGVDGLQYWANQTQDPAGPDSAGLDDEIVVWREGVALIEEGRPQFVVWHHDSSVAIDVPPGFMFVELEYVVSRQDELRSERMLAELNKLVEGGVDTESVVLELNGVVGTESFRFRDVVSIPKKIAKGTASLFLRTAGLPSSSSEGPSNRSAPGCTPTGTARSRAASSTRNVARPTWQLRVRGSMKQRKSKAGKL